MDTCIQSALEIEDCECKPSRFEKKHEDSSPLRRALRAHFESYGGLVEPRQEIANIALRPQKEDL